MLYGLGHSGQSLPDDWWQDEDDIPPMVGESAQVVPPAVSPQGTSNLPPVVGLEALEVPSVVGGGFETPPGALMPWTPPPQDPSQDWRVSWLQKNLFHFNLDQQAYLGMLQSRKRKEQALRRTGVSEEELSMWRRWDTFVKAEKLCLAVAWSMGPAIARNILNGGAPSAASRLVKAVDEAPQYHDMIHAADRILVATGVMPTGQAQVTLNVANVSASEARWQAYVERLAEKAKEKEKSS